MFETNVVYLLTLQQVKNPVPTPRKSVGHQRMGSDETMSSGFDSMLIHGSEGTTATVRDSPTPSATSGSSFAAPASSDNVGIVLVLQQRLKDAEDAKERLEKLLEEKENESPLSDKRRTQDLIRV